MHESYKNFTCEIMENERSLHNPFHQLLLTIESCLTVYQAISLFLNKVKLRINANNYTQVSSINKQIILLKHGLENFSMDMREKLSILKREIMDSDWTKKIFAEIMDIDQYEKLLCDAEKLEKNAIELAIDLTSDDIPYRNTLEKNDTRSLWWGIGFSTILVGSTFFLSGPVIYLTIFGIMSASFLVSSAQEKNSEEQAQTFKNNLRNIAQNAKNALLERQTQYQDTSFAVILLKEECTSNINSILESISDPSEDLPISFIQ